MASKLKKKAVKRAVKRKVARKATRKVTQLCGDRATQYARSVVAGKVLACRMVILACERHLRDLKNPALIWDAEEAERVMNFFPLLSHYKGEMAGQQFHLEPWQCFAIGSIFGWKWKSNGFRRYIRALIFLPRKNGKTFLGAGTGLYMMTLDGEPGAEIYAVATKEDQAKIAWNDARKIIKYSPELSERLRCKVKSIEYEDGDAIFTPLGSDSDTLDGLNPHCAVMDELHAWKSRELYDVIEDGIGARRQPLLLMITTAGYNQDGICHQIYEHIRNVLEGNDGYVDDRTFGLLYEADDKDDWGNEAEWYKANPNLGVSKTIESMRDQCNQAKLQKGKLNAFLNKQLNIWTNAERRWLDISVFRACGQQIDIDALRGQTCVLALDLANSSDFTAAVKVFKPSEATGNKWLFLPRLYLPEDSLGPNSPRKKYVLDIMRRWADAGHISLTPGNMTDDAYIIADIERDAAMYDVREIALDPWNARQIGVALGECGFEVIHFGQTIGNFTGPTKRFEALVSGGQVAHDGNPAVVWQAGNVVVRSDANENLRPDRQKSSEKIDAIVASIMGLGRWMAEPEGGKQSVYETRGLRIF